MSAFPCPHCGGEIIALAGELPKRGWGVYQLIGQDGRVMYVGMTGRPRARIRDHRQEFGDRIWQVLWEPHDSRTAAWDAETAAIRALNPPLNIAKAVP